VVSPETRYLIMDHAVHISPVMSETKNTTAKIVSHVEETFNIDSFNIDSFEREKKRIDFLRKNVPGGFKLYSDVGNVFRFFNMFHGQIKYCSGLGGWLYWNGKQWVVDETGETMLYAMKCVLNIYADLKNSKLDADEKKSIFQFASKSQSANRIDSMLKLAHAVFSIKHDELDSDSYSWLLNVENGVIDLKTGELLPHNPQRLITKIAPITYNPQAQCPIFNNFIASLFPDEPEMIQYLQKFFGYTLTAQTNEQMFLVGWGSGGNGKGTLFDVFLKLLGDYAVMTPSETLVKKEKDTGISNDVARLRGARFVLASEFPKGKKANSIFIKQATGQDVLAARFLHKEFFEFRAKFKLVLMTNDKPIMDGEDDAIWRRIKLVPFRQKFEGTKIDMSLRDKLTSQEELSGILNWCIQGCMLWQNDGLIPPAAVLEATSEYRDESSINNQWLTDCTIRQSNIKTKLAELHKNYSNWMSSNSISPIPNPKELCTFLVDKCGYKKKKTNAGIVIMDIGIIAAESDDNYIESCS